jgi:hypothetical protein
MMRQEGRVSEFTARSSLVWIAQVFNCSMPGRDPRQYGEADRTEVNPPIEVQLASGHQAARSTGG